MTLGIAQGVNTTDALAVLDAHEAALLAALDRALVLARSTPAETRIDQAKARWDLLRRARAYQLFKHVEIFDPGILRGTAARSGAAARMKAACLAAGEGVELFAVEWTGKDLVAEWPAYTAAVDAVAARMRAHIACERRTIADYLAQTPQTRPGGPPPPPGETART